MNLLIPLTTVALLGRLQEEEGDHTRIAIAPTSELGGKYRSDDLRDYFIKADLSSNPDKEVYDQLKESIGNTEWVGIIFIMQLHTLLCATST